MVTHHFDHGPDSSIFHGKRVKSAEAKESEARASRPRLEDIQQLIRGRIPIDSDVVGVWVYRIHGIHGILFLDILRLFLSYQLSITIIFGRYDQGEASLSLVSAASRG